MDLKFARLSVAGLLAALTLTAVIFTSCGTTSEPVPDREDPPPSTSTAPAPAPAPATPFKPLIDMVSVPGGTFTMGSPRNAGEANERPSHQVTVRTFLIGKHEVTQGQYFEVTGLRPSNFRTNKDDESRPDSWMQLPVEQVSWYSALVFCNKLSIKENLSPVYSINGKTNPDDWGQVPARNRPEWDKAEMIAGANGYRLPTEAEWEYAARGGGSSGNFNHAGSNTPNDVSWHFDNSDFRVREVAKKRPNELGLYDMSGNVMEWCWDWYDSYTSRAQENPAGPAEPSSTREPNRVIRGGGFSVAAQLGRVAYRSFNIPSYNGVNTGFRVARSQ